MFGIEFFRGSDVGIAARTISRQLPGFATPVQRRGRIKFWTYCS